MNQTYLLVLIFIVVSLIQTFYYLYYFIPFVFSSQSPLVIEKSKEAVSIIICAHNELKNLKENLPSFLHQNYDNYELLLVNDRSTDGSHEWLVAQQADHPRLKVLQIKQTPDNFNPKKYALSKGIEKAKNDIILLSDADCKPSSAYWIDKMAQSFAPSINIVLGASLYKTKRGFLNQFVRFETLQTALLYLSFSYQKETYMGVGRNLGYRKSYFIQKGSFEKIRGIMGGDDDLWVNSYATSENTAICVHPAAITFSNPKKSWSSFLRQKKRHLSVGKHYKTSDKVKLGLFHLSQVSVWFLFIFLSVLGNPSDCLILSALILIHIAGQYVVYYKLSIKFGIKFAHYLLVPLEILFIGYYWIWGAYASLTKHLKWK